MGYLTVRILQRVKSYYAHCTTDRSIMLVLKSLLSYFAYVQKYNKMLPWTLHTIYPPVAISIANATYNINRPL